LPPALAQLTAERLVNIRIEVLHVALAFDDVAVRECEDTRLRGLIIQEADLRVVGVFLLHRFGNLEVVWCVKDLLGEVGAGPYLWVYRTQDNCSDYWVLIQKLAEVGPTDLVLCIVQNLGIT